MSTYAADYVVVGGGLTGCTVASRLKQNNPAISVIILEAGPSPEGKHDATTPMGSFALRGHNLIGTTPHCQTMVLKVANTL